ncbi:MAG TPA: DNA polymerase I, partial [Thermoanaerobacterales bacterium]|nr:DNA polymerase I [Thermoanaerobacterales bacterium]
MKDKLIIIDGNSLFHRAFYALPTLRTSKGIYTNAVYGFTTMLLRLLEDESPNYVITAFDKKGPTFRHEVYNEYKGHRSKTPDELNSQFPILKKLLSAFNINTIEAEGYEADDIIGTISQKAEKLGIETLIVTGDKDTFQLITPNVKVLLTRKGISELELYDEKKVLEEYEMDPKKLIDMKGLMGDSSDNIPGVPGIGEKTAIKLMKQFGSFDNVFNNIGELKGKLKENLENYKEQAFMSRKLSEIVINVPVDLDLEKSKYCDYNRENAIELFKELEFSSLIDRMEIPNEDNNDIEFKTLNSISEIKKALETVEESGDMSINLGKRTLDSGKDIISNISFASDVENVYFVGEELLQKTWDMFHRILENDEVKKICHDAKKINLLLNKMGVKLNGLEIDTMIGAYLLDPSKSSYSLEKLAMEFMGYHMQSKSEDLEYYTCEKTKLQIKLKEIILSGLKKNDMITLLNEVEMPLIEVLTSMEIAGIKVDLTELETLSGKFGEKLETLTSKMFRRVYIK